MGGRSSKTESSKTVIGPYPDDGARRMPSMNSTAMTEAARNRRLQISARGGRTSTNLSGAGAGIRSYINSFLGSTG